MKKQLLFIITSFFCFLTFTISCTSSDDSYEEATPGSYTIEKVLHAIKDDANSRGINNSNTDFDIIYDPDYIYLHIVGSEETVYIPLYTTNCSSNEECKCFRYHIDILENGDAIVTPLLDAEGTPSSEKLHIPNGSSCYFSSVEESVWELTQSKDSSNQIISKADHNLYIQNDNINKEIYRSFENFSIAQLTNTDNDLIMGRGCAAFTVLGLFFDSKAMEDAIDEDYIELSVDTFTSIMGSDPSKWYIKIYSGGEPFVHKYDFGTMNMANDCNTTLNNGYYSTGNFLSGYQNHKFQPFKRRNYGMIGYTLESYGYYTPRNTRLMTPALNTVKALDVYILIKHWTGEGEPTEEWLASDSDALYTRMNITGDIYPYNNCFYILGLLMDIRQFKKAWDEAQATRPQQSSRSANGMHYFELENTKVIFERY